MTATPSAAPPAPPPAASPAPPNTEQTATELFEAAAHELASGRHRKNLVEELVHQGWEPGAAQEFIHCVSAAMRERSRTPQGRAELAARGWHQLQSGLSLVAGGIVAAWLSGRFFKDTNQAIPLLCFAAMAYGLMEAIAGCITWWPHRKALPPQPRSTR